MSLLSLRYEQLTQRALVSFSASCITFARYVEYPGLIDRPRLTPTYQKPSTNTTATAVVGNERINRSLRLSRRPYSSLPKPELYQHPLLPTDPSEQKVDRFVLGFVLGRANAFLDCRVADTGCLKMYRSYRGDSLEAVVDQL